MAVTFRAVGTSTNGTTSLALPQPAGTATGDVLVAFVLDHATSGTTTAPTGWTRAGGVASATGRFQVYTAVVGQNSLTGTSWTWSSLTTRAQGYIAGYSGGSTAFASQPDVAATARANASGSSGTTSITTVTNNSMVIAAFAALASGATWSAEAMATAPTITERADAANSTFCSVAFADGILATAGSTGASSATISSAGNNAGILLAIRPPTTLPTTTTQAASGVAATIAIGNGNITSIGDDINCTERGIVYSTSTQSAPGNVAPASSGYSGLANETGGAFGTGAFTETLTGLTANTAYFARAYSKNSVGYAYGSEVTFTTLTSSFIFVQSAWNSTAGTVPSPATTTLSFTPTAGNLICVDVDYLGSVTGFTLTLDDGNGHSFTLTPNSPFQYSTSARYIWKGYMLVAPSSSPMVLTATPSVAHGLSIHAIEFSYTGGTCTFDKDLGGFSTSGTSPITSPALNPTNANSLVYISAISDPAGSGTVSATNSPWTQGTRGTINSDTNNSVDAYITSVSSAIAANWTVAGSSATGWNAAAAAFFISASSNANVNATGSAATSALGTATASGTSNVSVSGVAATGSLGTATATGSANVSPAGFSASASLGTATFSGTANISVVGSSSTAALGLPVPSGTANVSVSGSSSTAALGAPDISGTANVSVSGVSATSALGAAIPSGSANVSVSGTSSTAALGDASVSGTANVSAVGLSSTASLGVPALSGTSNVSVAGVVAAASLGAASPSGTALVLAIGASATSALGVVFPSGDSNVGVSGAAATGQIGTAAAHGSANFIATGQEAISFLGTVSVIATPAAKRLPTLLILGV